ncbi:ATP-grasp domain-containing protein [Amycolatopsis sp. GM8]|uniref:ATP-grasp domain-containing protein n=1 Tax=Amycolatopsis sp. GM8 TaxID=2896530 RepID=UPI001F01F1CC|nr:ATP-grasp domain-containing protein [Amycolatopsis sp. GM8]
MPARRDLPRFGFVYDVGSASTVEIMAACRRICEPVFIPNSELARSQLRGAECDITGLSTEDAARVLHEHGVKHITTFSERQVLATAEVAEAAGLRYLSVAAARTCRDKILQRRALAETGVDVVRAAPIDSVADVPAALRETGLPAVLKPRQGMGSIDTVRADSLAEAEHWASTMAIGRTGPLGFMAEELLEGDPTRLGPEWGDYLSVESIVDGETIRHVCTTGRFPVTPPFRETSLFVPSPAGPELTDQAGELATAAIRALGITTGITHVELKLTESGPRVLEVNARLGGWVAGMLRRAAGYDIVAAALRAELGLPLPDLPAVPTQVSYRYFVHPPQEARRISAIAGEDNLAAIPGVRRYEPSLPVGSPVDWRSGTGGFVGTIVGDAADHEAVQTAVKAALKALSITYSTTG